MYLRSKLNTVGECRPQRHVHRTKAFQDASAKPPGPTDAPFRDRPALTSLRLGSLLSAPARPDWGKAQTRPLSIGSRLCRSATSFVPLYAPLRKRSAFHRPLPTEAKANIPISSSQVRTIPPS